MPSRILKVSNQDTLVGEIVFDAEKDQYTFAYAKQWLDHPDAFALSPHIPLSDESIGSGIVQRFLQNLLPEGRALDVVSTNHRISKDNVFGLVTLLGKEPAGALRFSLDELERPPEQSSLINGISDPVASQVSSPVTLQSERQRHGQIRRLIAPDELSARIRQRDFLPFPIWDGKVRLSVAGYQDKLQVLLEGDDISLVDGDLASTHILKPEPRNPITPCMVANEHFCMTLAANIGLTVAPVMIRRIPEPVLLIERFDRQTITSPDAKTIIGVKRRHVIDGCQALDLPVSHKYERNFGNGRDVKHIRDGVSFERLFNELSFDSQAVARLSLARWALLHLLLGNSDAHGKNISFFVRRDRLIPAPFYDLVSVNFYGDAVEQDMAMGYGDTFLPEEIGAFDLADFAKRANIPPRVVSRELIRLAVKAKEIAPTLAKSDHYVAAERDLVQSIAAFVVTNADRLLAIAPHITQVDENLL